jgi:ATP-dependent 26S proteasome regulatory subunit
MLLEFMSDTRMRGQVLFIAATNRPDMLDPALKRTGRFDKKIPFLPPNTIERARVLPAIVSRYDIKVDGKIDYEELATGIDGWVQSDMEAGIMKAYSIAGNDNRNAITEADIALALQKIIPSTQESELWTKIALMEVNDLDLLPPDKRDIFDRKQIQREVKTLTAESVQLGLEEHQRTARQRAL